MYESGYCSRADSMHAFKEMNFELPRHKGHAVPWSDRPSFPDKTDEEKKVRRHGLADPNQTRLN